MPPHKKKIRKKASSDAKNTFLEHLQKKEYWDLFVEIFHWILKRDGWDALEQFAKTCTKFAEGLRNDGDFNVVDKMLFYNFKGDVKTLVNYFSHEVSDDLTKRYLPIAQRLEKQYEDEPLLLEKLKEIANTVSNEDRHINLDEYTDRFFIFSHPMWRTQRD